LPLTTKRRPTIALLSKLRRPLNVIYGNARFTKFNRAWGNSIRKPIAIIVKLLRHGQRLGVIDGAINPQTIARTMVSMFQGIVLQRLWGEPFSTAEAMNAFNTFLAGIAKRDRVQSVGIGSRR
jgi:hypothetical protein